MPKRDRCAVLPVAAMQDVDDDPDRGGSKRIEGKLRVCTGIAHPGMAGPI
jgi:hypothetical protein